MDILIILIVVMASWVNNKKEKTNSKLYTVYMCSLLNVSYASVKLVS